MTTPEFPQTPRQIDVHHWLIQACQHPPGSPKRNYYLTKIIRTIGPKLWRAQDPYYADALQQTWLYFVQNSCTIYDPERASIVAWLNVYLRYRHKDYQIATAQTLKTQISLDAQIRTADGSYTRGIDHLPSPPYGSIDLLDQILHWVKTDPEGRLRQTHLHGDPAANAQIVLLLKLPPALVTWRMISLKLGHPLPTLASFYQRKCLPLLREFGCSEGFCD